MILFSYSNSSIKGRVLKLLALFYIFLFCDRPFLHVCNLEENILFHFNSWLGLQRLYAVFYGDNNTEATVRAHERGWWPRMFGVSLPKYFDVFLAKSCIPARFGSNNVLIEG